MAAPDLGDAPASAIESLKKVICSSNSIGISRFGYCGYKLRFTRRRAVLAQFEINRSKKLYI